MPSPSVCVRVSAQESAQTEVVVRLVRSCPRAVLMSGTPSLNRPFDLFCQVDSLWPGILGESKASFAESYCQLRVAVRDQQGGRGQWSTCSGGVRLRELHLLLREAGLVRRLKRDVAEELPPIRRQARRPPLGARRRFARRRAPACSSFVASGAHLISSRPLSA